MRGPLGETAGKNGRPELPAVGMTVLDLETELRKRGVVGGHVSLVGNRCTIVVTTANDDADATAPTLPEAAQMILDALPVLTERSGHA